MLNFSIRFCLYLLYCPLILVLLRLLLVLLRLLLVLLRLLLVLLRLLLVLLVLLLFLRGPAPADTRASLRCSVWLRTSPLFADILSSIGHSQFKWALQVFN